MTIQILTKWKCQFLLTDGSYATIFIFDNHLSNVLKKLSEIHFEYEALNAVITKE